MRPRVFVAAVLSVSMIALAAIVTGTPRSAIADHGLHGDVDCDTHASMTDVAKLIRYVLELPVSQTEPCPDIGTAMGPAPGLVMGDLNCDGAVNGVDALMLMRYRLGFSVTQVEPCPDIGTSDGGVVPPPAPTPLTPSDFEVSIESPAVVAAGDNITLDMMASAPGVDDLGAAEVRVAFDDSLVSLVGCLGGSNGICNPYIAADTVPFAWVNLPGLSGVLGTLTLQAGAAPGTAALDVQVENLTDTDGIPRSAAAVIDGTITVFVKGDLNCDGTVDGTDAHGLRRFVRGQDPLPQTEPCPDIGSAYGDYLIGDMDCDRDIDNADVRKLRRAVAGAPELPPAGCAPIAP